MKPVADPLPDNALRLLEQAVAFHQRGDLAQAEAAYRELLALTPESPHARRLLGVLRHQRSRHAEALDLIDGALDRSPEDAEAHANRGNVLLALQRGRQRSRATTTLWPCGRTTRTPTTLAATRS
jgi:tetratricopeptide (TPR) repeat protein